MFIVPKNGQASYGKRGYGIHRRQRPGPITAGAEEKSVLCINSAHFGVVIGKQVIYTYLVIIVLFWTLSAEEVGYFNDCQRGHLFWHI